MISNICEVAIGIERRCLSRQILMEKGLRDRMVRYCVEALPHKAYGLIGGPDQNHPTSLYRCTTNLRNTPEWKVIFESFGDFYKDPDRGFVISPRELQSILDKMDSRNESLIGTFHSHRCRCAEPSVLDIAMSSDPNLLCYIISVVEPANPEVGVFRLENGGYERIPLVIR